MLRKNEGLYFWYTVMALIIQVEVILEMSSTNGYNGEWIQINFGKKVKVYHFAITGQNSAYGIIQHQVVINYLE